MNYSNKGMWKRTVGLYWNIRIPWPLYILQIILGVISSKVALLYIPYESALKTRENIGPAVVLTYVGLMLLSVVMQGVESVPGFYSSGIVIRNLQNKLINRSLRLPIKSFEGSASRIGENGSRLSAGQRQRIAIARALMLDSSYLLLDEATCNMDVYSGKKVTDALTGLMKGRTTVIISHNMKMLEKADHVIVINNGVIEAEGTIAQTEQHSRTLRNLIAANA